MTTVPITWEQRGSRRFDGIVPWPDADGGQVTFFVVHESLVEACGWVVRSEVPGDFFDIGYDTADQAKQAAQDRLTAIVKTLAGVTR